QSLGSGRAASGARIGRAGRKLAGSSALRRRTFAPAALLACHSTGVSSARSRQRVLVAAAGGSRGGAAGPSPTRNWRSPGACRLHGRRIAKAALPGTLLRGGDRDW